jgi:hypothetical protein
MTRASSCVKVQRFQTLNQLRDAHLFVEMDRVQRCVLGDAFTISGNGWFPRVRWVWGSGSRGGAVVNAVALAGLAGAHFGSGRWVGARSPRKWRSHGPLRPRCESGRESGGKAAKNTIVFNGVTGNPQKRTFLTR